MPDDNTGCNLLLLKKVNAGFGIVKNNLFNKNVLLQSNNTFMYRSNSDQLFTPEELNEGDLEHH
jgi:hypothetical protein